MTVKCFLCRKETEILPSDTSDHLKPLDSCVALSKQLRVIFIVKNVLDSPTQQLKTYLQRSGNPEEWDVKLCSKCSEEVDKIQHLFLQLKKAYKLYEDARLKVKKKVYEITIGKEAEIKTENHDHHVDDDNVSTSSWNLETLVESNCYFDDHHQVEPDPTGDSIVSRNEVEPEAANISRRRSQRIQNVESQSMYLDGSDDDHDHDDADLSVAPEQQEESETVKRKAKTIGKRKYSARRSDKPFIEKRKRKYICKYEGCTKSYLDRRSYRDHIRRHEQSERKFECSDCGKLFYIRRNLYIHRLKTHKKTTPSTEELLKNYEATGLGSTSTPETMKRLFKDHIITLNDIRMYQCNFEGCTKTFKERERFAAHMSKHEGIPPHIPCLDCDECFYLSNDLSQHRAKMHAPKDPAGNLCHKCGKGFATPYQLKCHVRRCGIKRLRCPNSSCRENFMTKKGLERHSLVCSSKLKAKEMKTADVKVKWECKVCDKEFKTEKSYKSHMSYVHKAPDHVCDVCGYVAKLRRELLRHQANLHNIGEFKCTREGCGKQFYREQDLEDHEKYVHLGLERPRKYVCTFCGKGFYMSQGLRMHVEALHTKRESKPWKCEICGKGFAIQTYLVLHRKNTHKIL